MNRPPRDFSVLHVTQPFDGGVAGYVLDLAADQVRRGWRVSVASPPELEAGVLAAGAVHRTWIAGREPGPDTVRDTRRLGKIIAALEPDLAHLHSSKAGLAGRLVLRGRTPTVFQPHAWSFDAVEGLLRRGAILWERVAARWAHAVVCVSEGERRQGEAQRIRASWRVVPNGVDLAAWPEATDDDRRAARARLGIGEEPLAVCIGRLSRQKGQDLLLEAWQSVSGRADGARLVLVGDGPEEAALRGAAGAKVELVGPRDDVADWLAAADVIAIPSRWEGMSISMLEAMARGRSVVATDVPGAREALGEGTGAIVAPEQPGLLADAIALRLLDRGRTAAEGHAARLRAENGHDLSVTRAAIAGIYAELAGATGGRRRA